MSIEGEKVVVQEGRGYIEKLRMQSDDPQFQDYLDQVGATIALLIGSLESKEKLIQAQEKLIQAQEGKLDVQEKLIQNQEKLIDNRRRISLSTNKQAHER